MARPCAARAQRARHVVAPERRVRQALRRVMDVAGATCGGALSRSTAGEATSQRAFFGVAASLFAVSVAVTIAWCGSMSSMDGMAMPGGWTMAMTWMRMPGQTWPGAAA